jgi:uncharacterized membrane protein
MLLLFDTKEPKLIAYSIMKSTIGVYDTHEKAESALKELKDSGFPAKHLSIIGKANLRNNHVHINSNNNIEEAEVSIGVVAGSVLGLLTGIGVFVIPGLGFLYGAGALIGAFAGFDFGVIAGGFVSVLTGIGITEANAIIFEKHLNEGKFIVFAQGNDEQIAHAEKVMHTQGLSLELYNN